MKRASDTDRIDSSKLFTKEITPFHKRRKDIFWIFSIPSDFASLSSLVTGRPERNPNPRKSPEKAGDHACATAWNDSISFFSFFLPFFLFSFSIRWKEHLISLRVENHSHPRSQPEAKHGSAKNAAGWMLLSSFHASLVEGYVWLSRLFRAENLLKPR